MKNRLTSKLLSLLLTAALVLGMMPTTVFAEGAPPVGNPEKSPTALTTWDGTGTVTADTGESTIDISSADEKGGGTLTVPAGAEVTITGAATLKLGRLNFDIAQTAKVLWQASVKNGRLNPAVELLGNGEFDVQSGKIEQTFNNPAISKWSGTGAITVSGGTVSSTINTTISVNSDNVTVTVSGGTVQNSGLDTYSSAIYVGGANDVVQVSGGTVQNSGSKANSTAISAAGANAKVTVSGGTVSATTTTAISAAGANATVMVSGGVVENSAANNTNPVINMVTAPTEATTVNVTVSGTGTVQALASSGCAIQSSGSVKVEGGTVSATSGAAIYTSGTDSKVAVSGGKVTATSGRAIWSNGTDSKVAVSGGTVENKSNSSSDPVIYMVGVPAAPTTVNVTVSGTGTVQALASSGNAIRSSGSVKVEGGTVSATTGHAVNIGGANSTVTVSGGTVKATTGNVVNASGTSATVTVSGGLVFAYGSSIIGISNVIYAPNNANVFTGATATGIVIACNYVSGKNYVVHATTDITKDPASAMAYWSTNGTDSGIAYKSTTNTGFIPLGVTVTRTTLTANDLNFTAPSNTTYSGNAQGVGAVTM